MYKLLFTPFLIVFLTFSFASDAQAAKFFGISFPSLSAIDQVKNVKAQDSAQSQTPVSQPGASQENEEEDVPPEKIDPREIQNEVKQARDQLQQVNQVIATAKRAKATTAVAELESLKKQIKAFYDKLRALKTDTKGARDVLEEYRDAQLWDNINVIRRQVELPKELAEIGKRIKEAEKLLGNKQLQKAFTELGGDIEKLKKIVATMKDAQIQAQTAFDSGNSEEAEEALQDIRENGHPGELTGILHGMREFGGRLRYIRDAEIRDIIKELIQPIIEALNEGDIREARMTVDELGPEIERTMQKAMKLASKNRKVFIDGLDKLEQRINEKLDQAGMKNDKAEREEKAE